MRPLAAAVHDVARPDLVAVEAGDATLTYAELFGRAAALAAHLRALGTVDGSLVAVCLPRSAALVVASLGVLEAGGAYVALEPAQSGERLRRLIADAGVALVITDDPRLEEIDELGVARVAGVGTTVEPGLAYVMYTSGSTGAPKGVMVEQAGVINLLRWHGRAFGVGPGVRGSQLAGVGFDAAAWEIWGTLGNGGTLVVPPESVKTDPGGLRDWLLAAEIEVAFAPTPLAEAVVRLSWPAQAPLRYLLTGGDRLHAAPPEGLPFAFVNDYGLTEASVVTTSGLVAPGTGGLPSIGAPIDGVDVRVVDTDLREAAEGELLVGGVSVARGYLGAPALTAERFVELGGQRWYRTGDQVRLAADGTVGFVGRSDDQVQVRGFRVEPAEVEAALAEHPSVAAAAVRVRNGRLVAWFAGDADPGELASHVGERLPAHMVPAAYVPVTALPVTASGKVDLAALPSPPVAGAADGPDDGTESDELTVAVGALAAELLGLPAVGADENFLLLGGHSLLGAQLVIRLAESYGVELELRELFADPTPRGIAARVQDLLVEQILAEDPAS